MSKTRAGYRYALVSLSVALILTAGLPWARGAATPSVVTVVSGDFAGDSTVGSVKLTAFPSGMPIPNQPIYILVNAGGGRTNSGYKAFTTDEAGMAQFVHPRLGRRVGAIFEYYDTAKVVAEYNEKTDPPNNRPSNPEYVGDHGDLTIPAGAGGQRPVAIIAPPTVDNEPVAWDEVPLARTVRFVSISRDPDQGTPEPNLGIRHWHWVITAPGGLRTTNSGPAFPYEPIQVGTYQIRLVVWDNEGDTDFTETAFSVPPPSLHIEELAINGAPIRPVNNVGEYVAFKAVIRSATAISYQWEVSQPILKNFQENTGTGKRFTTFPMTAPDYGQEIIGFYWKPVAGQIRSQNVGPVIRRVDLRVITDAGVLTAFVEKVVERNETDETRQPVDIFINNPHHYTSYLGASGERISIPLGEHKAYHAGTITDFGDGNLGSWWDYSGSSFFQFHREFIEKYEGWRDEFGYDKEVKPWDSGTALPTDYEALDSTFKSYTPYPRPSWFTAAGGGGVRLPFSAFPSTRVCNFDGGEVRLTDFADLNDLGCAIVNPWHGQVHERVGGQMGPVDESPKTELFWRFHKFLNQVADEFSSLKPASVMGIIPPSYIPIIYYFPRTVQIEMTKPVEGLLPGDLTVNGSPATAIEGSGTGPFLFSGFEIPSAGEVIISFLPQLLQNRISSIQALREGPPSDSWTYRLLTPDNDEDGDGISNSDEIDLLLNPLSADTDGDGISDPQEIADGADPHVPDARLFVSVAGEATVRIRWPLFSIPAYLQTAQVPTGPWSGVTNVPVSSLTGNSVVLSLSAQSQFFRLLLPDGHSHGVPRPQQLSAIQPEAICGPPPPKSQAP